MLFYYVQENLKGPEIVIKKTKLLLRVNRTTIIEHNLKKISNIDLDQIFVNLHFQKDALKKNYSI